MKDLKSLTEAMEASLIQGDWTQQVSGIKYDSRKVEPGDLFVCISGFKVDGHKFITQVVESGAGAIIIEKDVEIPPEVTVLKVPDSRKALANIAAVFYNHPSDKLRLIGVTGTNGKTTTTYLIEAILTEADKKVGLVGTIENRIGHHAFPVTHTTPESLELQQLLSLMVTEEADYGVMEVSSHALDLGRVKGTEFDVAIFTNLTQDHLDYHQSFEEYLKAKSLLFKDLGKKARKNNAKFGVVNVDDEYSKYFTNNTNEEIITFGVEQACDVKATQVNVTDKGVSYLLKYWGGAFWLNLKLTGLFNVYNSLAAAAVTLKDGVSPEVVKKALEKITGVAGRFESVNYGQDFSIVVDYAHTPDSLENILLTAQGFVKGRIISVFGCGGDRDRTKRPVMGQIGAKYSDYCIITSDNPRSEEPYQIIEDIIPGVEREMDKTKYKVVENRSEAIEKAIKMAEKEDIIIIAGKGHETYQIIKDEVFPFDDRLVAKQVLRSMGYNENKNK